MQIYLKIKSTLSTYLYLQISTLQDSNELRQLSRAVSPVYLAMSVLAEDQQTASPNSRSSTINGPVVCTQSPGPVYMSKTKKV